MHKCCNLNLILLTNSIQSWVFGPSSISLISEPPFSLKYQPCHLFQANALDKGALMKHGWAMMWAVIHNRFNICQTVYSHTQSVAHLDIKPQNVLINREKCKAIFCDFGISVKAASIHVSNGGTPYYISSKVTPCWTVTVCGKHLSFWSYHSVSFRHNSTAIGQVRDCKYSLGSEYTYKDVWFDPCCEKFPKGLPESFFLLCTMIAENPNKRIMA